jgi:hypothetical protein
MFLEDHMPDQQALFPDFNQELAEKAQRDLAQTVGMQLLSLNTANAAAEIYSRRLQHVETLYFQGQEKLSEFEATLADLREQVAALTVETDRLPQDAEPLQTHAVEDL